MARFVVDSQLNEGCVHRLEGPQAHHALRSLRLRVGEPVTLINGQPGYWHGRLVDASREMAAIQVDRFEAQETELAQRITVIQGLCAAEKVDWLIEKLVELGAASVALVETQRSVAKIAEERADRKRLHWRSIALAATAQSGRTAVMQVEGPSPLASRLIPGSSPVLRLLLTPRASVHLQRIEPPQVGVPVELLVGPEGGLSDDEERAAISAGFQPVHLGPRILRTETAGMAALAIIGSHWA